MHETVAQSKTNRLISLDAMRGFTIAAMILVNYPGSEEFVYKPLEHAEWNGLTPTDLIYPIFLFIIGISIVLSYSRLLENGSTKNQLYKKIIFRSIKFFAVGLFLNLLPTFDLVNMRITGVLQRISIVFMVCSFIFLNVSIKKQIWLAVGVLVTYWLAMTLIPIPGIVHVVLEPGRNLAAYVDTILLPGKMWRETWDPEGILSTFPAVVSGMAGLFAGYLLLSKRTHLEKVIVLMIFGFVSIIAGYILGLTFPINKNIWTSSYVLVTSGIAALIFGTLYYIVDIRNFTSGMKPGIIFGSNAIAVYFIADVISYIFYLIPFASAALNEHFMNTLIAIGFVPQAASMFYAMIFVLINFCIAYFLFKKNVFIKL